MTNPIGAGATWPLERIEKKLETVLSILGHGRQKSDAELEREAEAMFERIRLDTERREQRKKERLAMPVDGKKKRGK